MMDEKRAWVTILSTNSYINGVVVLDRSLKTVKSKYPLYCVITDEVSEENIEVLTKLGIRIIHKPQIVPNGLTYEDGINQTIFGNTWHLAMVKLHVFDLTAFDKIVYIDSDVILLQNMDDLFDKPHMTASQGLYTWWSGPVNNSFNSGLMVIQPNHYIFTNILRYYNKLCNEILGKELIHDERIIDEFYPSWNSLYDKLRLDTEYNPWTTYFREEDLYYPTHSVKSIHIIEVKPWNKNKQYFINCMQKYPAYARLCLWYIDVLNWTIKDLNNKGITSSDLKIIE